MRVTLDLAIGGGLGGDEEFAPGVGSRRLEVRDWRLDGVEDIHHLNLDGFGSLGEVIHVRGLDFGEAFFPVQARHQELAALVEIHGPGMDHPAGAPPVDLADGLRAFILFRSKQHGLGR